MDESRKIIIIAGASIMASLYGYWYGYLTLTEYYIVFMGLIIPGIGGYTGWNFFLRKAFSLHFQIEEGEHLREVGFVRIVPYDKDGQIYTFRERQFLINGRHGVWTDRFNKTHLFFPFNNTFAFHPYAEVYNANDKDIPQEFVRYIDQQKIDNDYSKPIKPDEILSPEQAKKQQEEHKESRIKLPITTIPIQFFTLMKVDALEFLNLFAGKLMIARVEEGRKQHNKPDKSFALMLGIMMLMVGVIVGYLVIPMYTGHFATGITNSNPPPVTTGNSGNQQLPPVRDISTTTSISTNQTVPKNASITGESSITSGNTTTSFTTYVYQNNTVTITHTITH